MVLSFVLCRGDLDLEHKSMVDSGMIFVFVVRFQEVVHEVDIVLIGSVKLVHELLVFDRLLC
jgi:hypothetical protein